MRLHRLIGDQIAGAAMATFTAAIFLAGSAAAQPPTADAILQSAKTQAAQVQRAIGVTFHASW
jgi:hypothetical protein